MTNTDKLTDRKIYAAIAEGTLDTLDVDTIVAWAEKKIAQLDHKAAKAKETAAAEVLEAKAEEAPVDSAAIAKAEEEKKRKEEETETKQGHFLDTETEAQSLAVPMPCSHRHRLCPRQQLPVQRH